MRTFYIVGRNTKSKNALKKTLKRLGFEYRIIKPGFIISLGGDGTFLFSERKYPGIPKILMRDSNICKKCDDLEYDELFMKILLGNYVIVKHMKLEAIHNRKKYLATNDFIIRNKTPVHAIRFLVDVDDKEMPLIIGDGIVVSTPFGSSGYHESITRKTFKEGIGLAFNNTTVDFKHKVLHENSIVKIKLLRHDAHFGVDNDPKIMTFRQGETITIKRSKKTSKVIKVI